MKMKPILIAIIPLIASAGSTFPNLRLASKTTACSSSLPPASFVLSSRSRSALSFRNTKPAIPSIMKDKEQDSSRALHSSLSRSNESTNDITEIIRAESQCQMSILAERFPTVSSSESNQPSLTTLFSKSNYLSKYIDDNIDAILFDCDGVLYRGTDPIPSAADSLASLVNRRNKKIFFVTNNAGSNREQLRDKLAKLLDMENLKEEQMVTSSYSAARYLQRELLGGNDEEDSVGGVNRPRVHVIGTSGLCSEIELAGFSVEGGPSEDPRSGMTRDELAEYPFPDNVINPEARIDAIVVGLDNEFNYRKLCIANVLMQRNPNAIFVSTNEDAYDLVGADARHLPGNGALVKALEHCSGRKAVCVGKPSPLLAELIADDHELNIDKTLFVGDRLDTDVRFGVESGMKSALVLTGCTKAERLLELCKATEGRGTVEEPMPTIIFPHVGMMSEGYD